MTHSLSPQNSVFPFKPSPEYVSKIISRLSKTNSTYPAIWVLLPEFAFSCTASSVARSITVEKSKKKKSRTSLHKDDPYAYCLRKWRAMSKHSVLERFLTSGLWSHKWVLKAVWAFWNSVQCKTSCTCTDIFCEKGSKQVQKWVCDTHQKFHGASQLLKSEDQGTLHHIYTQKHKHMNTHVHTEL